VSAPHPTTKRAPSLYPGDAEVIADWCARPRIVRAASEDAEPRDRLREAGEIPGIDRWSPPEVPW
jgi:hypothetical protein